jgi:hypothetical protein
MNHYIRQAIKWRKGTPERQNKIEKIVNTIRSCRTDQQLYSAIRLVETSSSNSMEKEQLMDVVMDVAVNHAKDCTAEVGTFHNNFTLSSLLWWITGFKCEQEGIIITRAVFKPTMQEVDLRRFNVSHKLNET